MDSGPTPWPSRGRIPRLTCFTLLTISLTYAAFDQGGRTAVGWNASLVILGAAAILYLLVTSSRDRPRLMRRLLSWAVLLPPVYVAFQLLPLPLPLLRILSPARAHLVDSLLPITQVPAFAPITIDPAITAIYLVRTLAYSLTTLLICEISWYGWRRRSWAPVIPIIAIAALEAFLGIFQFANSGEVSGTYRSKDHFAGLLEMALPLAVAFGISLLRVPEEKESLPVSKALQACAAFAFGAAMLVGLVYSLSKMGFVAGLGGLLAIGILAVLSRLNGVGRWLAVATLAVAFILVFAFLPTDQLRKLVRKLLFKRCGFS